MGSVDAPRRARGRLYIHFSRCWRRKGPKKGPKRLKGPKKGTARPRLLLTTPPLGRPGRRNTGRRTIVVLVLILFLFLLLFLFLVLLLLRFLLR